VWAMAGRSLCDPAGADHTVPERPAEREKFALSIVEMCKDRTDGQRLDFMAYLSRETAPCDGQLDHDAQAFMSWDDVRGLVTTGFDLGSHTMTHPILSNVSPSQLCRELRESRATIESHTGAKCRALAYPNGRSRDISELVVSETGKAGYELAFTVSNRWCRRDSDPLKLDRIAPPGHSSLPTFALHASGWRQFIAARKIVPASQSA
jgi:peptidoglycan/xylan/chitin deacetylase (PgdA/CDA1 family)